MNAGGGERRQKKEGRTGGDDRPLAPARNAADAVTARAAAPNARSRADAQTWEQECPNVRMW